MYPLPPGAATEADEAALSSHRTRLHLTLGLPLDRPLLRLANAVDPGAATASAAGAAAGRGGKAGGRLADVHAGLGPSGVVGGSVHLVQGTYEYYHYMQVLPLHAGWGDTGRGRGGRAWQMGAEAHTAD